VRTRFPILAILLMLILPQLTPTAAQDTTWRVEAPVRLSEALDGFLAPAHHIYLAPDGRHVAYENEAKGGLCALDMPTRQEQCVSLPPELGYSFPLNDFYPAMRWSPDSTKIALIGVPYIYFRDTDLGLADFSGSVPTFTNLADDGYQGGMSPGTFDPAMTLETNPGFSPDSAQIAVERVGVTAQGQFASSTLSIFDIATDDVREVSTLPGHKAYPVDVGSIIGIDWSPDGKTLAVALHHVRAEPLYDGIWLVDVASDVWTRKVSLADSHNILQPLFGDTPDTIITAPVRWSPDGSRLLFWVGDPAGLVGHPWLFWLDQESGNITPIDLPTTPLDRPNLRMIWPAQAVWSPDGSQLLVAAHMQTPPDSEEAKPLVETDEVLVTALYLFDMPSGERTLLGHLPLEIAPSYVAAWGSEGDVLAGGYSFKLVRD
jgi:WD40 repeat protein